MTVEANPEDVTEAWAKVMAAAGVNRVSLGVQSFDPVVLDSLGRRHAATSVRGAARAIAGAGIEHLSIDLIYGAAEESNASWQATLEAAVNLDPAPSHISAYALTIEAGTPLAADRRRHPDDDVQADRYEITDKLLSAGGLEWYEISNWARRGNECRHNLTYWRGGNYRGIGCAAHSHRDGRRWWNLRTPERYIAAIEEGQTVTAVAEQLSPTERALELLELSLRTREGVPEDAFGDRLGALVGDGLVSLRAANGGGDGSGSGRSSGRRAVLTLRGRLLANEVACALADGRPPEPVAEPGAKPGAEPGAEPGQRKHQHQMQRDYPSRRHLPLS